MDYCLELTRPLAQFLADRQRYLYEHPEGGPLSLEFARRYEAARCSEIPGNDALVSGILNGRRF